MLDGGFPALLHHLVTARGGKLEPLIINHDSEKFAAFMEASGRGAEGGGSGSGSGERGGWPSADLKTGVEGRRAEARARAGRNVYPQKQPHNGAQQGQMPGQGDGEEQLAVALAVARRLQHGRMAAALSARLAAGAKGRAASSP